MSAIQSLIDEDIRESALALIREHGHLAYGYAVERANEVRAKGRPQVSRQWAAVAWAVNDMIARPTSH